MVTTSLKLKSKLTGRCYWEARYHDGTVVREDIEDWNPLSQKVRDWALIKRKGLVQIRLYCPDGKIAALGNPIDASDRLFQFKIAVAATGPVGRQTLANVIGIIDGTNGECTCFSWEYGNGLVGPFRDNFNDFKYGGPVTQRLDALALGVRPT
jgi:hypothetical protein